LEVELYHHADIRIQKVTLTKMFNEKELMNKLHFLQKKFLHLRRKRENSAANLDGDIQTPNRLSPKNIFNIPPICLFDSSIDEGCDGDRVVKMVGEVSWGKMKILKKVGEGENGDENKR
jgi:hypothetical protein